jgi:tetratricopeptide (TPR) repeat protein
LLARANQLRAQRRWGLAESTYRQVLRSGATDKQRYVALVAAASIALQHLGRPAQAAELYQRALGLFPNGELSEEALVGSAESYRALHRPEAELAALLRLSAQYPDSLRAPTTQRRLAQLELIEADRAVPSDDAP